MSNHIISNTDSWKVITTLSFLAMFQYKQPLKSSGQSTLLIKEMIYLKSALFGILFGIVP